MKAHARRVAHGSLCGLFCAAALMLSAAPAAADPPEVVSISPSAASGTVQRFDVVFRDADGVDDLRETYLLINRTNTRATSAVHFFYAPATNQLFMRDDGDLAWGGGGLVGVQASGYLANSQAWIDMTEVVVSRTSTGLTLSIPLHFKARFAGQQNLYALAVDDSGQRSAPLHQLLGYLHGGGDTPRDTMDARRFRRGRQD